MFDEHWEDHTEEERKEVFNAYAAYLLKKEGVVLNWEDVNIQWTGSRWITIYYTFSANYLR